MQLSLEGWRSHFQITVISFINGESNLRISRFDWPRPFGLKTFKPNFYIFKVYIGMPNIKLIHLFFFRQSWFKNSAIWLAENLFDLIKLKISKPTFAFLQSVTACKNHTDWHYCFWDIADSRIWLVKSIFDHTQLKILTSLFIFIHSISHAKKSCWLTQLVI